MSEQITWSRFVGPSLPDSLVLANYQSWLMTIDHQETWNSCQRVLCCHIWIILRNTWIWRIIAKYFLRSFSKYFWEQSDTINQLIIADLQSDEWRRRKQKREYCHHGQTAEAESLDSVKPNQLWFMIDTCWLQNWFFSNKIIQRGTNSRQTPDNQLSIIYHQGGTVLFLISFNKK